MVERTKVPIPTSPKSLGHPYGVKGGPKARGLNAKTLKKTPI